MKLWRVLKLASTWLYLSILLLGSLTMTLLAVTAVVWLFATYGSVGFFLVWLGIVSGLAFFAWSKP